MEQIVHRVWAGPPMPDDYRKFGERWAELNPDWQVWEWDEAAVLNQDWINQSVVDDLYRRDDGRRSIELFAQLADVVDYELIFHFGGVYVNCDVEPVRPLDHVEADPPWVATEDPKFVVNAAMAGPRQHQFFGQVIDALAKSYWANPDGPMNRTTGPWLLTQVWRERDDVAALPVEVFNPHHWKTIRKGGDASGLPIPAATVGVHHWGHRRDGRSNTI